MRDQLEKIRVEASQQIHSAENLDSLNELKVKYLGKKGLLTQILKQMGGLSAEERPIIGAFSNEVKREIEDLIDEKVTILSEKVKREKILAEEIDVTISGNPLDFANLHPITSLTNELKEIFIGMGFTVAEGPEVETEYYNFEALNLPFWHPARDMQDSFYIREGILLRTHTSSVQVRTMEKGELPIRIISLGSAYRADELDATHSPNFHQVEALVIDKNINFGHLKETLDLMVKGLFGENCKTRLRPSYFPFTEPSAEVDMTCTFCGGDGCPICKNSGWLELGGSGMVHPRVLEMSNIDPEVYSGFAFGMGIERFAQLKYGINNIRLLFDNDLRFLKQ